MSSLASSNRYLRTAVIRKDAVERNVRSSSAIEGVSGKVFRKAAGTAVTFHAPAVKGRRTK